jgi:hypothetical protein
MLCYGMYSGGVSVCHRMNHKLPSVSDRGSQGGLRTRQEWATQPTLPRPGLEPSAM